MHEIITIQLGQRANYLATHFWNTQESYFTYSENDEKLSQINHDVHFRPGLSPDGKTETFMPRTVIYDLKGAFGSMKKINALYEVDGGYGDGNGSGSGSGGGDPSSSSLWHPNKLTVQKSDPVPASAYTLALDAGLRPPTLTGSSVRYFSDFSRVYYHPRSVVQLNEYQANSSVMPFEQHETGAELFAELDREHDLLDRDLRFFLEEADCAQGLQVAVGGLDDAWGGFAGKLTERVRDEVGTKTPVWVWGLQGAAGSGLPREKRRLMLGNKAKAVVELYKHASMLVPLAVPESRGGRIRGVKVDAASLWEGMGLLAAGVESALLATRLRDASKRVSMGSLVDGLNALGGQRMAGLRMAFEGRKMDENEGREGSGKRKLTEEELSEGVRLGISFDPVDRLDGHGGGRKPWGNGDEFPRVFSQVVTSRGYEDEEKEDDESSSGMRMKRRSEYEPVTTSCTTTLPFPILDSYPAVFRDEESDEPLRGAVNITTSLSADSSVYKRLKTLRSDVVPYIALEDRETLGNDLMEMADEYHEGWSSGSDDGEDD